MLYLKRDIENTLLKYLKQFSVVAVTGARQTGKTTLLKKTLSKKYKYITFDDVLVRERALSDPKLFIEEIGHYVILDEIQYVPGLLSYLKIIIDNNRDKKGLFVFTGSQQFHLMKNLGDSLAGRIGLLNLFTFSNNEIQRKIKLINDKDYFIRACLSGTFPENIVNISNNTDWWYSSYINTYLERDVKSIYNIGLIREFQKFIQILASRCSQVLNVNSLSRDIGVSVTSINNWLSILEASQIIYILKPYYNNLGKRITKSPKIYFMDCGIVCYLTGLTTDKHILNGPLSGALFENYCITEVLKQYYNSGIKEKIYYLRTHNGLEIDLIIEKNMKVCPIEIKLTKTPKTSMIEPINRFKKIFQKLNIHEGKILCLTDERFKISRDVTCINPSQININEFG